MARKLALKRLTASDLTFFNWHYVNRPAGNQKAINLNAEVFIDRLYPSLPEIAIERQWRFPLDLSLYGPQSHGAYNIQRKIIKGATYKNWRLDGEFIFNPEDEPERFNSLEPGDMVVFEFIGPIYPHSARLVLLARSSSVDAALVKGFEALIGDRSMVALSPGDLTGIAEGAQAPEGHPILELVLEDALEDAAQGGIRGIGGLRRRPGRRTSREELDRARVRASQIGHLGETFVDSYLRARRASGQVDDFSWVSEENAVASHDFKSSLDDETTVNIDVKSTNGRFGNPIHISYAELIEMGASERRYDLYRVFEIDEEKQVAYMRIAEDVGRFALRILKSIEQMPDGVEPDSFSVDPGTLTFGDIVELAITDDTDED